MNEEYKLAPNIITGKDLDYLSDMFQWNIGAYKNTMSAINSVQDEEIKNMLEGSAEIFKNSLTRVLNILNGGSNE